VYEKEEEAIAKLVVEEIHREMWSDLTAGLPSNHKMRKMVTKAMYKTINATVTPPVTAAWAAMRKVSEQLKPVIADVMEKALEPMIRTEIEVKAKISDALQAAMKPMVSAMSDLVGPLMQAVVPKLLQPFLEVIPEDKRKHWAGDVELAVRTGDHDKLEHIHKDVKELRHVLKDKMAEAVEKALEPILGDFKGKCAVEVLMIIFSPLKHLHKLLKHLVEFFDPDVQFKTLKSLLEWKQKIKDAGPAYPDLEKLLDSEEFDLDYWQLWRNNSSIRWSGWDVSWELYRLLDDCGSVVNVWDRFVYDYAKINHRAFTKFSWRFGDFLSERAQAGGITDWPGTVDDCFLRGYHKGVKTYLKYLKKYFTRAMRRSLDALVVGKIANLVKEGAAAAIEPLQSMIPDPVDKLVDLGAMVDDVITDAFDNLIMDIVSTIHPMFAEQIARKRELKSLGRKLLQGTPYTLPPRPPKESGKEEADKKPKKKKKNAYKKFNLNGGLPAGSQPAPRDAAPAHNGHNAAAAAAPNNTHHATPDASHHAGGAAAPMGATAHTVTPVVATSQPVWDQHQQQQQQPVPQQQNQAQFGPPQTAGYAQQQPYQQQQQQQLPAGSYLGPRQPVAEPVYAVTSYLDEQQQHQQYQQQQQQPYVGATQQQQYDQLYGVGGSMQAQLQHQ
jgi:hypothetical protein